MTVSTIEHAATLAARLMKWSEFCASTSEFRAAYFNEHGGHYLTATPYRAAMDALRLIRIGKSAARRAVQACNGIERRGADGRWAAQWTENDEARKERADAKALRQANEILRRYHAEARLQGDPRGYVMRIRFLYDNSANPDWHGVA